MKRQILNPRGIKTGYFMILLGIAMVASTIVAALYILYSIFCTAVFGAPYDFRSIIFLAFAAGLNLSTWRLNKKLEKELANGKN